MTKIFAVTLFLLSAISLSIGAAPEAVSKSDKSQPLQKTAIEQVVGKKASSCQVSTSIQTESDLDALIAKILQERQEAATDVIALERCCNGFKNCDGKAKRKSCEACGGTQTGGGLCVPTK